MEKANSINDKEIVGIDDLNKVLVDGDEFISTRDINLAAYLSLKGYAPEVTKADNIGIFKFTGSDIKEERNKYFKNTGKFLAFASELRNLKANIKNL